MDTIGLISEYYTTQAWVMVVIAYLIGTISPAIILGKIMGVDIKKEGSGNAGTTNVLRVLGKKAALITLVVDICKGILAVELGLHLMTYKVAILCALAVFCGHIWPCFFGFKGGKGVATAFGAILAINWMLGLSALAITAIVLLISKRMSAGSIAGAVTFPILCYFLEPGFFWVGLAMALIVLKKHKDNIIRLVKGQEPIMSIFKSKDENNDRY